MTSKYYKVRARNKKFPEDLLLMVHERDLEYEKYLKCGCHEIFEDVTQVD